MKHFRYILWLISLLAGGVVSGDDISPDQVRQAIEGGVEFLKATQLKSGSWGEEEVHRGGVSALCTLALLNCGVPIDDPALERALRFQRTVNPTTGPVESNYVASLQLMVFCMADPKKYQKEILRNVEWLVKTQKQTGKRVGSWGYPYGFGDPSNAQFALLALYEASRLGVPVGEETWKNAADYWMNTQNIDGSWAYTYVPPELERGQAPGTGSMTCAGIVSLLISAEKSLLADARISGELFLPCQRQDNVILKHISHARRWMATHFSVARNPGNKDWQLYYLYGLERMGRMTEQRFIGEHDWFREGTAQLLSQSKTAVRRDRVVTCWKGATSSEKIEPISTSLALLFLSKGRYPLLLSKVQTDDKSEDWNWHRHDVRNLARYVEKFWKRNLTTQSVHLRQATVEDLLQSPVLYLSGKDSPLPKDETQLREMARKLRDYIDRGGFVIGEAVCPGGTFDDGFRQLVQAIFPEPEQSLAPVPAEHPLWHAEARIPAEYLRPIYSIEYGCRTCLLFLPAAPNARPSLSCVWELADELRPGNPHSEAVCGELRAGLNLGRNILAYATNRELKTKDENFSVAPQEETPAANLPGVRGKLAVANLRHGGGCEAAPRALRNLLLEASGRLNVRAGVLEKTLPITSPELFRYPVMFLQGRNAFRFTPKEREILQRYLQNGGLLFVNSICASKAFDEAFRRELKAILPDATLTPLPSTDPLLTTKYGGFDLTRTQVRHPQKGLSTETTRLEAATVEGRYAVIYSPLDLSCALEKHPGMDCHGYTVEDAMKIGINVLLYAMQ
ncbi:MAG: DUF4159 domain-containing protein [Planctomycetia bacterium]|nr:DUF4159 domain-containing protein [Planctomycetia bacterium]